MFRLIIYLPCFDPMSCFLVLFSALFRPQLTCAIDDYAKDGGKELFTKMHCALITNP